MSKIVFVIHEKDLKYQEEDVLGVVSDINNVDNLLKDYYGKYETINFRDIRDSTIEYVKTIKVDGLKFEITVQSFFLDNNMVNLNNEIKTHLKIKLQNLGFLFSSEEKLDEFINSRIGISHSLFDENTYNVYLDDKELLFTVENNKIC